MIVTSNSLVIKFFALFVASTMYSEYYYCYHSINLQNKHSTYSYVMAVWGGLLFQAVLPSCRLFITFDFKSLSLRLFLIRYCIKSDGNNKVKSFRSQLYFGAFFFFKKCFSKSPKVFHIVLQYFGDPSSKGTSRGWASLDVMFFGHQTKLKFCEPSCLVFAMCQGLSNLLRLLAVRLNELETTFILIQQQNITYSEVLKWFIFLGFHRVRMLTNNTNCHY